MYHKAAVVCHRILGVLCRDLRLSPDFDFPCLARQTPGYVGADLMALAREAAITAVNRWGLRANVCLIVYGFIRGGNEICNLTDGML